VILLLLHFKQVATLSENVNYSVETETLTVGVVLGVIGGVFLGMLISQIMTHFIEMKQAREALLTGGTQDSSNI